MILSFNSKSDWTILQWPPKVALTAKMINLSALFKRQKRSNNYNHNQQVKSNTKKLFLESLWHYLQTRTIKQPPIQTKFSNDSPVNVQYVLPSRDIYDSLYIRRRKKKKEEKRMNLWCIDVKPCSVSRVSVQGVESLWGDCRFIPADWGS